MNREDVLRKVRACLRLSKSANANEAAAAARQAQKLIEAYAIDQAELSEQDQEPICEAIHRRRGHKVPVYVAELANLVCNMCSVEVFVGGDLDNSALHFVGPRTAAEVAQYSFEVLLRQLERAKRAHISRVRKASNRAARGDQFGSGWVHGCWRAMGIADQRTTSTRIAEYMKRYKTETVHPEARKSKAVTVNDRYAGHLAGRNAKLAPGVGSDQPGPLALGQG